MPQRKVYGEVETKKGVTDVLEAVLSTYPFTCISELNAVLKQFGVVADGGKERGRIHQNKGLVYRMLDKAGNKVGVPLFAVLPFCLVSLFALYLSSKNWIVLFWGSCFGL